MRGTATVGRCFFGNKPTSLALALYDNIYCMMVASVMTNDAVKVLLS